jgi:hypothetical protein
MLNQIEPGLTSVYGISEGKRYVFSGIADLFKVSLLDQDAESEIVGRGNGSAVMLRHESLRAQFTFARAGSRCAGYDFSSGRPYYGTSREGMVQLYDAEQAQFFVYRK